MSDSTASSNPPSLRARLFGVLAAWTLLFLACPGVLLAQGSTVLAVLGCGAWGAVAVRPLGPRRRRAVGAEWVAAGAGFAGLMGWVGYVIWPGLVWIFLGAGAYFALGGVWLRALARRGPLVPSVALAWVGIETLRDVIPPPFGLGWLRLGHQAHQHLALAGSARVWGVEGLSFVLASLAGLVAALWIRRRLTRGDLAWGLAPALLGLALAALIGPPSTVDGPRVLLVQPAFPQARKQFDPPRENFLASRSLTLQALAAAEERGEPPVDLVAWGESMLYVPLFEPGVEEALDAGLEPAPWVGALDRRTVEGWRRQEHAWVQGELLGLDPQARPTSAGFPPGTSFVCGAEVFTVRDDELRRLNAVVLYGPDGSRSAPAAKRFLVPGAESMLGLERFGFVRDAIYSLAAYVPDFDAADTTGVLTLTTHDEREFRFGGSVCFDNAFLAPYVDPVKAGPLDFHLVVSNEAWYHESWEMDQMVAFSRMAALATGRAFVRATNSGVSLVLGPDGTEVGRVLEDGRDRSVPGTLTAVIPVPEPELRASRTPYVRLRRVGLALWLSLPLLALVRAPRRTEPVA